MDRRGELSIPSSRLAGEGAGRVGLRDAWPDGIAVAELVSLLPVGLGVLDTELRLRCVNEALAGSAGRTVEGSLGCTLREFLPEPDALELACVSVLNTGVPLRDLDLRPPTGTGPQTSLRMNVFPLTTESDNTVGIALTVQEMPAREPDLARLQALQTVTAAMAGAGSLDEVLQVALVEAASAVGGSAASIGLIDPPHDTLRTLKVGFPPAVAERFHRVSRDALLPGPATFRDGRSRAWSSREEAAREFPSYLQIVEGTPFHAAAVEPLQLSGRRFGYLAVHFVAECAVPAADRTLLAAIAAQCAVAVDRARRAEAERNEREQAQRLQMLASQLAVAASADDVVRVLAGDGAVMLGATLALIAVHDAPSRTLSLVAAPHSSPAEIQTRFATWSVDDPVPSRDLFATGEPVLLSSLSERNRRYPALADIDLDQQAFASLLLQARGRPLGMVTFGWDNEREFSDVDVKQMQVVAELCSASLERARLADEQRLIADTLQRGLLPPRLPRIPGWQLAARYLPSGSAAQTGGDWYDAFRLPAGQLGLIVGDVAGHGVAAAALMGQVRALARAEARSGAGPAPVMARLNAAVCDLTAGQDETLVTCCYLQLDRRNALLTAASAGHLAPMLRSQGEVHDIAIVPGPPLGVLRAVRYTEHRQLLPGDATILLYTDGLVERHDEPLATGLNRLRQCLRTAPHQLEQTCDHLLADLIDTHHRADDIALIAAQAGHPDAPPR
jgi:serine phosphatase RsbU (regulator of sigma subunit)